MSSRKSKKSRRAIGWDGLRERGVLYSKNHVRRLWETGLFPRPFNLSKRTIVWWADEIDQWVASKAKEAAA
jgi:predicted DNA-binding transcriptional regulator AlpA